MLITLHKPEGIIVIDSDTITDEELATIGVKRENLPIVRDLAAEIDGLKADVKILKAK